MKSEIIVAVCLSVVAILVFSTTVTEALPRCRPGAMLCRPNGRRNLIAKPNQDLEDAKDTSESRLRKRQEENGVDADYNWPEIDERTLRKLKRFLESRN